MRPGIFLVALLNKNDYKLNWTFFNKKRLSGSFWRKPIKKGPETKSTQLSQMNESPEFVLKITKYMSQGAWLTDYEPEFMVAKKWFQIYEIDRIFPKILKSLILA